MALVKITREVGYFPSYIKQRIERKKNFLCVITGQTGSGKSMASLRLAEQLDPDFDERNICFTPNEFLDLIDGKTKKLKAGSVIVWDELQVAMSNMDFQSMVAKMVNFLLQTFRYQNYIVIMTTPHFSFVNAGARKLFHCRMETISINKNAKTCKLKPLLLQTNQSTGKVYEKFLRVKLAGRKVVPLKRINVGLPSKELIKAYDDKKDIFNQNMRDDIKSELENKDASDIKKPLTKKQQVVVEYLEQGMKVPEIAELLGCYPAQVYQHFKFLRRKGIAITAVKEGAKVLRYEVSA